VKGLRRLAAAYGVLTSYYGVDSLSRARPEALLAALRILGAPVETFDDVDDALHARTEEIRRRLVEPVLVLWDDEPAALPFSLLREAEGRGDVTIALESGGALEHGFDVSDAKPVRVRNSRVERRVFLTERPPIGYHRLSLRAGAERGEAHLLCAPGRSYRSGPRAREWGLFAPLYATTSRESFGAGDLSDLERLVELTSSYGGSFVATLPLLATFVEEPSPYSPVSRRFWNELYVDPRRLPEWPTSERIATGEGEEDPFVDYDALSRRKRPLLESLARKARRRRGAELDAFTRARPDVLDYARFRAEREKRRDGELNVLYHVYGQMAAEEQLGRVAARASRAGVKLYFDLPLGVHGSGFDTSERRELFAFGADVGAPPDVVFTDGQNWGFPPLLPRASRAEAHRYVRECVAHAMRHASLLRVDHVMGLHRQFWIPAGFEKRDGVYVRYPADELYAVFNIESHRHRCELVGENLGIVPDSVTWRLARHGWRGIYVLQFSLTGRREEPTMPIPRSAVASFNTHDTPTFAGFLGSRDLEERVEAGLLSRAEADGLSRSRAAAVEALDGSPSDVRGRFERWLSLLLESDADLVAIALEDLWLEEAPQNVPGRADLPNWRRKLRHRIDALPPEALRTLEKMGRQR
jgi:4-alpha-glucanotransferase